MQEKQRGHNEEVWSFGFERRRIWVTLKWGFLAGSAISIIEFPYKSVVTKEIPEIYEVYFHALSGNVYFSLIIAITIIPFFEELIFRGWLYRFLRNKYSIFIGYIGSTFLFVLAHGSHAGFFLCTISSLILVFVYEKTRSLGASIVAHSLWNGIWYAAIFYSQNISNIL